MHSGCPRTSLSAIIGLLFILSLCLTLIHSAPSYAAGPEFSNVKDDNTRYPRPLGSTAAIAKVQRFYSLVPQRPEYAVDFRDPEEPAIHAAIRTNDWPTVQKFVQDGADINCLNRHLQTPLLLAIGLGHVDLAKNLVGAGANVNLPDKTAIRTITPINPPANGRSRSMTISREPWQKTEIPISPLTLALERSNEAMSNFLLENGAVFNELETTSYGTRSLRIALSSGLFGVVGKILSQADLQQKEIILRDLILWAVRGSGDNEHADVKYLIAHGANLETFNEKGQPLLMLAVVDGDLELVTLLLDNGAKVDTPTASLQDGRGSTSLEQALSYERIDIAEFLRKRGATINTDRFNMVELIMRDQGNVVDFLMANNFDLNRRVSYSSRGYTPLVFACENGKSSYVKKFIAHGVNVNLADSIGKTPLISATESGNLEIVKILVEAGADINHEIKGNEFMGQTGVNAYTLARGYGKKDIAEFLKAKGADTSGFITNPLTIGMMKQIGILPPEAEGLPAREYELIKAMLVAELGLNFMDKFNNPDPQFSSPEKTWEIYQKALVAGDLELAAKCHRHGSKYIETYKALGPETTREIAMNFRPIEKITGDEKSCKYRITREQNGVDITYYIYFVNVFGEWKIDQL